jgi:hypothetical protein
MALLPSSPSRVWFGGIFLPGFSTSAVLRRSHLTDQPDATSGLLPAAVARSPALVGWSIKDTACCVFMCRHPWSIQQGKALRRPAGKATQDCTHARCHITCTCNVPCGMATRNMTRGSDATCTPARMSYGCMLCTLHAVLHVVCTLYVVRCMLSCVAWSRVVRAGTSITWAIAPVAPAASTSTAPLRRALLCPWPNCQWMARSTRRLCKCWLVITIILHSYPYCMYSYPYCFYLYPCCFHSGPQPSVTACAASFSASGLWSGQIVPIGFRV